MKKIIFSLLIALIVIPCSVQAKKLQAFMSYSTFDSPAEGPYIETYLTIVGKSAVFVKNASDKYQGTIEITIIFSQNDVVKQFRKVNLLSPELSDTNNLNFAFIDQQRFALPNGEYTIDIQIKDLNDNATPFKASETVDINYLRDAISVSGVELVDKYSKTETPGVLSKSGYDLVPYILNFYPENITKMIYYAEVYNTDRVFGADTKYLSSVYIETYETGKLYGEMIKIKKEVSKQVNVVFGEFDLSLLPSGNYNLVIEVKDQTNRLISYNKMFFQRDNPAVAGTLTDVSNVSVENTFVNRITSPDTLRDYVKCLYPISSETERQYARNLMKRPETKAMQQYFYNFWVTRNTSNPEGAWLVYKLEVDKVNAAYSTMI